MEVLTFLYEQRQTITSYHCKPSQRGERINTAK